MRWDFSPSYVVEDRLSYLREEIDFGWLVRTIRAESRVTDFKIEPAENPDLGGSTRPVFQLEIKPKTFDLFYNSPWGYRGRYCLGVVNGLQCNQQLLASLVDPLLDFARKYARVNDVEIDAIHKSLKLPTAKVWVDEGQIDLKNCSLREELLHPEWIRHAREARAERDAKRTPTPKEKANAIFGVRATCGRILDVKGAWVTKAGDEVVDEDKKHRAEHIRDYGFS